MYWMLGRRSATRSCEAIADRGTQSHASALALTTILWGTALSDGAPDGVFSTDQHAHEPLPLAISGQRVDYLALCDPSPGTSPKHPIEFAAKCRKAGDAVVDGDQVGFRNGIH
jgi:hypothetical protein